MLTRRTELESQLVMKLRYRHRAGCRLSAHIFSPYPQRCISQSCNGAEETKLGRFVRAGSTRAFVWGAAPS